MNSDVIAFISVWCAYFLLSTCALDFLNICDDKIKAKWFFKPLTIFCFFAWPVPIALFIVYAVAIVPFVKLFKTLRG